LTLYLLLNIAVGSAHSSDKSGLVNSKFQIINNNFTFYLLPQMFAGSPCWERAFYRQTENCQQVF